MVEVVEEKGEEQEQMVEVENVYLHQEHKDVVLVLLALLDIVQFQVGLELAAVIKKRVQEVVTREHVVLLVSNRIKDLIVKEELIQLVV